MFALNQCVRFGQNRRSFKGLTILSRCNTLFDIIYLQPKCGCPGLIFPKMVLRLLNRLRRCLPLHLVRLRFDALNDFLTVIINISQRTISGVRIDIPTLRNRRMLVGKRSIGAGEPPLKARVVSRAEVIESGLNVPFFLGELLSNASICKQQFSFFSHSLQAPDFVFSPPRYVIQDFSNVGISHR